MPVPAFFNKTKPTLSDGTKAQYLARYQMLRKGFGKASGHNDLTPEEVVGKLIVRKPELSMATWRHYKNSVLYVLESRFPHLQIAIDHLRAESSAGLERRSRRTSGSKSKEVPAEDWKALQRNLNRRIKHGYRHSTGLLNVLNATLSTGLRPNEWCHSTISKHAATGRDVLRVRNSKHTNGRGNGDYREIFIDEVSAMERKSIEDALVYCAATNDGEAQRIQLALRNEFVIARGNKHMDDESTGNSLTMYSFRHQFMADAKLTFEEPVMIAALAGHSSTKTAFEHYGKRRNGKGRIKVSPTPESLEAVLNITLESYKAFVANRSQSRNLTP